MNDESRFSVTNLSTEHAAAAVVIGALVLLFLIRRGFRGIAAGGVNLTVN